MVLRGWRQGRGPTGLQRVNAAPDVSELDHHDEQGQEHDPDHEAEHHLLEGEPGLLFIPGAR